MTTTATENTPPPRHLPAYARVAISFVLGIVAGVVAEVFLHLGRLAFMIGWDVAASAYLIGVAFTVTQFDRIDDTKFMALSEDPGRGWVDVLLIAASLASLVAVGMALVEASNAHGSDKAILAGVGVFSVVISWVLVHTVYTWTYARLYYSDPEGGVDFNMPDGEKPHYMEFAYLAFTVGMTYQVSDTDIKSPKIRAAVLHQALLSFVFGTVIIATTINLIAGLTSSH